jgi:hypothetical protein
MIEVVMTWNLKADIDPQAYQAFSKKAVDLALR